jgi:hypothetical protein
VHNQPIGINLRTRDHLQVVRLELRGFLTEQRRQRQGVGGNGVTVGVAAYQIVDHDDAGTAGAVFNDDILAEFDSQQPGHGAGINIHRRSCCRPAEYGHRPHWIRLCCSACRSRKRHDPDNNLI